MPSGLLSSGRQEIPAVSQLQSEKGDEVAVYRQTFDLHWLSVERTAPGHLCLRGNGVRGECNVCDGRISKKHFTEAFSAETVIVGDIELYYILPVIAHVEAFHVFYLQSDEEGADDEDK